MSVDPRRLPITDGTLQRIRDLLKPDFVRATNGMARHRAKIGSAANQSIPNSVSTVATLPTTIYDKGGLHVGNTLVVKRSGLYVLSAVAYFDTSNAGERWVRFTKNAAFFGEDYVGPPNPVPGSATIIPIAGQDELEKDDVIGVQVLQSSGGALLLVNAGSLPHLAIAEVS